MSVITPAKDVGPWLGQALASVADQTMGDLEHLVVDNGSTDDTATVARRWAARDARIRVLCEARPGSAAARNRGLDEAGGRYLCFLDGDDWWSPDKLARQLDVMASLPSSYAGTFCRSRIVDEVGRPQATYRPPSGRYDLVRFLSWMNPAGNGSSFLVRRSCADAVGGFDESLSAMVDMDWLLRITDRAPSPFLHASEEVLVNYRLRPGRISDRSAGRAEALETVIGRYAGRLGPDEEPQMWVRPALHAFRTGLDAPARRWAARAVSGGRVPLLRSGDGRRLLLYATVGPATVTRMRGVARSAAGVVHVAGRLRAPRVGVVEEGGAVQP